MPGALRGPSTPNARSTRPAVVALLAAMALLLASATSSALGADEPGASPSGDPSPGTVGAMDVQPDIVVLMLDDLGYLPDDDVVSRLPAMRRLWLEGGLRFTQMHAETPLCCPARATFLSGRHTLAHGVLENDGNPLDQERTLPVALDTAGYHTVLVGKYLNRWRGTVTPPGWDHVAMAKGAYRPAFWVNGELTSFRPMHVDEANHVQVVDAIEAAPLDEPLFLLASVRAPHADQCLGDDAAEVEEDGPCYEPRVIERDVGAAECAGIPDARPPSYSLTGPDGTSLGMPDWPDGWKLTPVCESLLEIDRMVADAVAAQAARGRPAWFVLMSDNGMAWGQHGSPFKRVPWATRTPFYVAGPGVTPGETDALASTIDVPATIADIAGADIPWADGESLRPLLGGEDGGEGRTEMLEIQPGSWAGVRTDEWHYIEWEDGRRRLFRYRDDPWELEDLATVEAGTADALALRLDELLAESAS